MELAFRNRIAMVKDPNRRKYSLADRYIEVVSEKLTGEVLLDEALKMIGSTEERMSVGQWIDLMSGKGNDVVLTLALFDFSPEFALDILTHIIESLFLFVFIFISIC